jgi:hypothetical protein
MVVACIKRQVVLIIVTLPGAGSWLIRVRYIREYVHFDTPVHRHGRGAFDLTFPFSKSTMDYLLLPSDYGV